MKSQSQVNRQETKQRVDITSAPTFLQRTFDEDIPDVSSQRHLADRSTSSMPISPSEITHLQQTIGNQATIQLLRQREANKKPITVMGSVNPDYKVTRFFQQDTEQAREPVVETVYEDTRDIQNSDVQRTQSHHGPDKKSSEASQSNGHQEIQRVYFSGKIDFPQVTLSESEEKSKRKKKRKPTFLYIKDLIDRYNSTNEHNLAELSRIEAAIEITRSRNWSDQFSRFAPLACQRVPRK